MPGHIARMQAAAAKAASPDPRAAAARNARPSFNAAPSQASYTPPPRSTENEFAARAASVSSPAPSGAKVPAHIRRMEAARAKALA